MSSLKNCGIQTNTSCRNTFLNFIKGLACIGIVFIHIQFPNKFGMIVKNLGSYAVPIFFMISGYYIYTCDLQVVKRRLSKIIKIFIVAYLTFFILYGSQAIINGNVIEWIRHVFCIKSFVKLVVFCTIDFAIPLWYLVAQIETYIFWMIIVRLGYEEKVTKYIPLLFVSQVVLVSICETKGFSWFYKVNFMTSSFS